MKEIRIPRGRFDLDGFYENTIEFLKSLLIPGVAPTYPMVWVESPGDAPVYAPDADTGWDVLEGLQQGKMVFFPFAFFLGPENRLICADGNL